MHLARTTLTETKDKTKKHLTAFFCGTYVVHEKCKIKPYTH